MGEDVALRLTVQDVGPSPITVYDECVTHSGYAHIVVLDVNLEPLTAPLPHVSPGCSYSGAIHPERYLRPGGMEWHEFSLLRDAHLSLSSPGTFTVQMVYLGWSESTHSTVFVRSNVVAVTVSPAAASYSPSDIAALVTLANSFSRGYTDKNHLKGEFSRHKFVWKQDGHYEWWCFSSVYRAGTGTDRVAG